MFGSLFTWPVRVTACNSTSDFQNILNHCNRDCTANTVQAEDRAMMSLKLVFVVLCAATVAFAPPPGGQHEFFDNKKETTTQVCDDPCILCELLKDREAQIKGASSDAKQQLQQSKSKDFLSMARIAVPSEERKAAAEGACIEVCAQCSAVRERKAEEQAMINAIVKMLLSQ